MKINYSKVAEHLGVKLRGNETFDELLKIEQQVKEHKERQERIAEENANIQRVDAQVKKYWGKKWKTHTKTNTKQIKNVLDARNIYTKR